jgi:beta-lactam-binding protein with PASTA domain
MIKNIFAFFKSRIFLINFGIAIVALPLLFWIILWWLSSYTRHNDLVTVPDFKDLKISQLASFVVGKKVDYQIIDSIWDPTLQKGVVLKQDPYAGDSVKDGRVIYLYVTASQPPKIAMPDLAGINSNIGLSERQAIRICESYGLGYNIKLVPDNREDLVVGQSLNGKAIAPGTLIDKGSKITLSIGKGEGGGGEIDIPNLIGMNFRSARGKLIDKGLEWVLIADQGVKDTLNATVYSQDPPPSHDRKILPGATIDLRISNDKNKVDTARNP